MEQIHDTTTPRHEAPDDVRAQLRGLPIFDSFDPGAECIVLAEGQAFIVAIAAAAVLLGMDLEPRPGRAFVLVTGARLAIVDVPAHRLPRAGEA